MITRAQLRAATAAVADCLHLSTEEIESYCAIAQTAGYRHRLDQLATVLVAANEPEGVLGPKAADPITAAIWRESPRRQEDGALRLAAEVRRKTKWGRWQAQVRETATGQPPHDRDRFARWCRDNDAQRRRSRDGFGGGQVEIPV